LSLLQESMNILDKIREAGVIGAGGAGFPTYAKLRTPMEFVIANGSECEPLLCVDQQLMATYPEDIIRGLEIAMELTGAMRGILAVKEKYGAAIGALEVALQGAQAAISLVLLRDFYPAGDEQVLVYETTGRVVPEGGLPLDVGCVVFNVGTLRNIAAAVEGTPVTHRFVSVLGAVHAPRTLNLPIGCLASDVLEMCGGPSVKNYIVLDGGPMMGRLSPGYVLKTTTDLLVLPASHSLSEAKLLTLPAHYRHSMSVCDQCFACTEVCPRYLLGHRLEPHIVMRDVANGIRIDRSKHFLAMAYLCCHCDLCRVWGCPVNLAPGEVMRDLKEKLRGAQITNPYTARDCVVRDIRNGRAPSVKGLTKRLGLRAYDVPAPIDTHPQPVNEVKISLHQHIGAPCVPVVKPGDRVRAGQLIGTVEEQQLGVPIHASISGRVEQVTRDYIHIIAE
jgi:Na+-translocating ferredoxin:NAD+ oxidoreductase RnfC subunit